MMKKNILFFLLIGTAVPLTSQNLMAGEKTKSQSETTAKKLTKKQSKKLRMALIQINRMLTRDEKLDKEDRLKIFGSGITVDQLKKIHAEIRKQKKTDRAKKDILDKVDAIVDADKNVKKEENIKTFADYLPSEMVEVFKTRKINLDNPEHAKQILEKEQQFLALTKENIENKIEKAAATMQKQPEIQKLISETFAKVQNSYPTDNPCVFQEDLQKALTPLGVNKTSLEEARNELHKKVSSIDSHMAQEELDELNQQKSTLQERIKAEEEEKNKAQSESAQKIATNKLSKLTRELQRNEDDIEHVQRNLLAVKIHQALKSDPVTTPKLSKLEALLEKQRSEIVSEQ